jgi:hypothetical protein
LHVPLNFCLSAAGVGYPVDLPLLCEPKAANEI